MTKPVWLRAQPAVRQFILGEVERQYHPIGTQEYKERVEWMTDAWLWAQENSFAADKGVWKDWLEVPRNPTVDDMLFLAARIEPEVNYDGYRTGPVWIGDREAPDYREVPRLVERLWQHVNEVVPVQGKGHFGKFTADDFYLEFEHIHPFFDGNGRTGKVIHNWLLHKLDDPVLIHDYFGMGNP